MSEISYLKLYTFGRLTITDRIQPVDKVSPTIMNLLKEPEYEVSINVIDAIDHFICAGLTKTPTLSNYVELVVQAYNKYSFAISLKLNITTLDQFKVFCHKRYHNEGQRVRIAGIVIELSGVNLLG